MDRQQTRRLRIKRSVFLAAWILFAPQAPRAAQSDALIKGTTDFLLDRAYDNYVYILQTRLLSNPFLKQYLPNTVRVAQAGDLRSLLTHKDLWKKAVQQDLENLGNLETVGKDVVPVVVQMCRIARSAAEGLEESLKKICGLAESGELLSGDTKALAGALAAPSQSLQRLEPLFLGLKSDQLRVARQAILELVDSLHRVKAACKKPEDGAWVYTRCVVEIAAVLKGAAHAEYVVHCKSADLGLYCFDFSERKLGVREGGGNPGMREEDRNFSDFLGYALFFAQMADAEDRDTVKALLKSVTVPPVSFGLKRERFRTGLFLSSYVGVGFITSAADRTSRREYIVSAPIGLEMTQALSGGDSLSFLLSPVDFGYPISLKLNDVDKTVKTSDIIVPGAYLFYGVRKYPVALGLGYTRVRSIENPERRAGRVLVVLAFDLPLYSLY